MPTAKTAANNARRSHHILRPEIRALIPDANDPAVQARIKAAVAALDPEDEAEALRWIESVSMFDNEDRDLE